MSKTGIISVSQRHKILNPTWQHIHFPDSHPLWLSRKYKKKITTVMAWVIHGGNSSYLWRLIIRSVWESSSWRSSILTSRCFARSRLQWWWQLVGGTHCLLPQRFTCSYWTEEGLAGTRGQSVWFGGKRPVGSWPLRANISRDSFWQRVWQRAVPLFNEDCDEFTIAKVQLSHLAAGVLVQFSTMGIDLCPFCSGGVWRKPSHVLAVVWALSCSPV